MSFMVLKNFTYVYYHINYKLSVSLTSLTALNSQ